MSQTEHGAEPTPRQILDCPMDPNDNDAGASSVRGYLVELLAAVWREQEGFSGKRPFGNSSWDWEPMGALVKAGLLNGAIDQDGYVDDVDDQRGHELIAQAIQSLDQAD